MKHLKRFNEQYGSDIEEEEEDVDENRIKNMGTWKKSVFRVEIDMDKLRNFVTKDPACVGDSISDILDSVERYIKSL